MASYEVVKGGGTPRNLNLIAFTDDLVSCVSYACKEIAREISRSPDGAFGIEDHVEKSSTTLGGTSAESFSGTVTAPHANAYARHFMSIKGKTIRMDLGNLIEQRAVELLKEHCDHWIKGTHYLYQSSIVWPGFPVNYMGTTKSARPDIRFALDGKNEAVFDFTTPLQVGHLLRKTINRQPIEMHSEIPIAIEIIWDDRDLFFEA